MLTLQLKRTLLCIYHKVICQMPVAYYARVRISRYPGLSKSAPRIDYDDPAAYKLSEMYEDEEQLSERPPSDTRSPQRTVFKTIERKFFRPPQEVNLLTWDAKEQIRYLHQEFPDEWTVEKLSQSFPISVGGVQRLLRSKFQPRTVNEVIRHDRRVQKAWKALKDTRKGKLTSGPIISRYEMLKENNQLKLLSHAAGHKYLPHSDWHQKMLEADSAKDQQPGVYKSLITDYLKLKMAKDEIMSSLTKEQQCILSDNSLSNEVYLQLLVKNISEEKDTTASDASNQAMKREKKITNETYDEESRREIPSIITRNNNSNTDKPIRLRASITNQSFLASKKDQNNYDERTDIGLRDTKKLSLSHRPADNKIDEFDGIPEDEIRKLQKENVSWLPSEKASPESESTDAVYFESPVGSDVTEPYMYNPDTGYQYPFGRRRDLPKETIDMSKIKKPSKNDTILVQDGKDVYDEDGEFLYRIP